MIEISPEQLQDQREAFREAQRTGFPVEDSYGEIWYPIEPRAPPPEWALRETNYTYDSSRIHRGLWDD